MLPLILPVCRLRPHVISWIFFAILVACADRDRLRAKYLVPLTIVWVNVHVYWLLVPLMVFINRALFPGRGTLRTRMQGAAQTVGYLLLGFINPYGWRIFSGVWEYLFAHQTADASISEFAPFTVVHYEYFWVYLVILALALLSIRTLLAKERFANVAVMLLFAVATLNRIKYLPLFALSALPILRTILDGLLERFAVVGDERVGRTGARAMSLGWFAPLCALSMFVLAAAFVRVQPVLLGPHRELFEIAQQLQRNPTLRHDGNVNVLTDYNYAGWLLLAFWLNRPPGALESRFKVAIDGRTLVIGQQRIREYAVLRSMESGWPDVFRAWHLDVVVLPSQAAMIEVLASPAHEFASLGTWTTAYRTLMWTVLVRQATGSG